MSTRIVNCDCCCPCTITVSTPQGCAPIDSASDDFQVSPNDCDDQDSLPGDTGGSLRFWLDSTGHSGVISIAAPDSIVCDTETLYFSHWLIDAGCCIQNFGDFKDDGGTPPDVYCHYDKVLTIRLCNAAGATAAGGCSCTITPVYGQPIANWDCKCCSCYADNVRGSDCSCEIDAEDVGAGSPCYDPDPSCDAGNGGMRHINGLLTCSRISGPPNPNKQPFIDAYSPTVFSAEFIGKTACGDQGTGGCGWEDYREGEVSTIGCECESAGPVVQGCPTFDHPEEYWCTEPTYYLSVIPSFAPYPWTFDVWASVGVGNCPSNNSPPLSPIAERPFFVTAVNQPLDFDPAEYASHEAACMGLRAAMTGSFSLPFGGLACEGSSLVAVEYDNELTLA